MKPIATLVCVLGLVAALGHALAPRVAAAGQVVTTSLMIPFQETVFVTNNTPPEGVLLTGQLHLVIQVAIPADPCYPVDPCRSVPYSVHTNLAGVSGVGQTTGLPYTASGATQASGVTSLPGGFAIQAHYRLLPPSPITPLAAILPVTGSVALSAGGTATQATATTSLVGYWKGEGNADDDQNLNPGTLVGNVAFVPGKLGQAFAFNSQQPGFVEVEVTEPSTLEPATVTAMAWVRSQGVFSTNAYVLSKGANMCHAASYALYAPPGGGLRFHIYDGTTLVESPDADIWDDNWHLAAGTYDGATVRLYVDGVEIGTGTLTTIPIDYNLASTRNFHIGAYGYSQCPLRFTGAIDEVRIFNRALTASEIAVIYNAEQE